MKLVERLPKYFKPDDVQKIIKAIPGVLRTQNKLLPGFANATEQADWVIRKLGEIGDINDPSTWTKLDNLVNLVADIENDWRRVAELDSFDDFIQITESWGSSRRGYSFENWIRHQKAKKELPGGDFEGFTEWKHLTFRAEDLGEEISFATVSGTRRADRYVVKATGGRIWDFKHYKSWSNSESFRKQFVDYIKTLEASADHTGLAYLFSDENIAKQAFASMQSWQTGLNSPISKTVSVLFVDAEGLIRRAGRIQL